MLQMALRRLLLSLLGLAAGKPVVFTFTYGNYSSWETWRWDVMTHLGFWEAPNEEVTAKARENGVKLLTDAQLLQPADWTDAAKRREFVSRRMVDVKQAGFDGLFFDFEGHLSGEQKAAYTKLAKEMSAGLAAVNGSLVVCVGGRPTYEQRDYDYEGIAEAADFLFVMGYDMHFWDDYTCVTKGTCSPAEAPIRDLQLGVSEYLQAGVSAQKLVLGLPWYGQVYTEVVIPINEGQISYSHVLDVIDSGRVESKVLDGDSQSWVLTCKGQCYDKKKGNTIWFDDAATLAPKYRLARAHGLRGVGAWQAGLLPRGDAHRAEREAMWNAMADAGATVLNV